MGRSHHAISKTQCGLRACTVMAVSLMLCAMPATAQAPGANAEQLYDQGVAARRSGDNVRAATLLGQSLAADPNNTDAMVQLGFAYLATERLDDAERVFQKAIAVAPNYDDARIGLARIAQRRGDAAAALRLLEPVASGNADAASLRAQLTRASGMGPRGQCEIRPIDGSPDYVRGVEARRVGNYPLAVEFLTRALATDPGDVDTRLQLGLALYGAGRIEDAERAFQETLVVAPDYDDARIGLARIAYRRGDAAGARRLIEGIASCNVDAAELRARLRAQSGLLQPTGDGLATGAGIATSDAPRDARWRVDLDGSYSVLNRGREDWQEGTLRLTRFVDRDTAVGGAVEVSRRFGNIDVFGETRIDHRFAPGASGYLAVGGTPSADFRPEWQVSGGGALRIVPGRNPTVLTLNARQSHYRTGDIQLLSPGIEQYLAGGRAWLTGQWINSFDEDGDHLSGYLVRGDVLATDRLRLFAGLADAPETSEGIAQEVFAVFGGGSYEITERTAVRLSVAHEDRERGAQRTEVQIGTGIKF